MKLESSAFRDGQPIPERYSRDGGDTSPPLSWADAPSGTRSLTLICDDPDAPRGTWVHWVYYDLPPSLTALPPGIHKADRPNPGGVQGRNDYKETGWGGPQPPKGHGPHRYSFRLSALDRELGLSPGATKAEVESAMQGHVLAEAKLTGTYRRD